MSTLNGVGFDGQPAPLPLHLQPQAARIRLLKFVTVFAIGGTERQVVGMAQGLDRTRFDLHLACLRCMGELLKQVDTLEHSGLVEYKITNLFNRGALRERVRFARYLRRHRIEIVHTYSFYPNVFAIPAARLARTPVVVASIRDMGAYLTPLQRRVQRAMCRLAHRVVVNAEAVRQWLIADGYDPSRITVIPNGLDLARFSPRPSRSAIRRELGLPLEAPLVAVVSRLSPTKGLEYFLEAAALVAATRPDVRFLLVGEAAENERDYRQRLEADAARRGLGRRVIFTGLRLDVPEILTEVAVSVLPSLSEGLSNVLLESMAAEVPVVATRVGGTEEAVEDGLTGFVVPPRDARALATAIHRVLDDPALAGRFGRAGRLRVVRQFSMEAAVRDTEELYRQLLHARRGPAGRGRP
jgi:glycosyltransferase involved in cell wall biosynthesis